MSDANRVDIFYTEEVTWGTTPSVAMDTVAGATSFAFGSDTQTITSNVIRSDYVKPRVKRTQASSGPSMGVELIYKDLDKFFEGGLREAFTSPITHTATDITPSTGPDAFTRIAGSWITDGFVVGMVVKSSGWTGGLTANNARFTVISVTALVLTVLETVTSGASGDSATFKNDGFLKNGITLKSNTLETDNADLSTSPFTNIQGARVGGLDFSFNTGEAVVGTVSWDGKLPAPAAASQGNGSFTAGPTTSCFTGLDVAQIYEGGAALAVDATALSFNYQSGNRPRWALNEDVSPLSIGGNAFDLSGTLEAYNGDAAAALLNKRYNHTISSLSWHVVDESGNVYCFRAPQLRYISGDRDPSSGDSDITIPLGWQAELDSVTGAIFTISKLDA